MWWAWCSAPGRQFYGGEGENTRERKRGGWGEKEKSFLGELTNFENSLGHDLNVF